MPIFRSDNKLSLFSHIPKCAGSSIESYCLNNGVKHGFINYHFTATPEAQRWNKTSPQHIDGKSLSRIFPNDFFDHYFAVVRDPFPRLVSAFKFQKNREKRIENHRSLSDFVKTDLQENALKIGFCDNHFLPQTKFFFPNQNYKIFKFEHGFKNLKKYIDTTIIEKEIDAEIPHKNKSKSETHLKDQQLLLDNEAKEIFLDIYAEDYKKLKYPTIIDDHL